jgi:hypothetical protein
MRNRGSPRTIENGGWSFGECNICFETYIDSTDGNPEDDARFAEVSAGFLGWHLPIRSILSLPVCPSVGRLNVCRTCMDEVIVRGLRRGEAATGIRCPGGCGQRLTDELVRRLASRQVLDKYETHKTVLDSSRSHSYFLERRDQMKECPKCGIRIEKLDGCNQITCRIPSCRHKFCWECLANERVADLRYHWYDWQYDHRDQRSLNEQHKAWLEIKFEAWLHGYVFLRQDQRPYLVWLRDQTDEWIQGQYQAWVQGHDEDVTIIPSSNGHHPECSDYERFLYSHDASDDSEASNDSNAPYASNASDDTADWPAFEDDDSDPGDFADDESDESDDSAATVRFKRVPNVKVMWRIRKALLGL